MPRRSASARTTRSSPRLLPGRFLLGLLLLGLASGCPDKRPVRPPTGDLPTGERVEIGVYKARVTREDGRSRRFRLLLYAELPDRLHAEAVAPVGGTQLIVDGNAERLSIALVRDKLSFAGPPTGEDLRRIVGASLRPEQLVSALLRGCPHPPAPNPPATDASATPSTSCAQEGYSYRREGAPGLPERFELRSGGHRLELELRRVQRSKPTGSALGSGDPPPGFERYPISDLNWDWFASEAG